MANPLICRVPYVQAHLLLRVTWCQVSLSGLPPDSQWVEQGSHWCQDCMSVLMTDGHASWAGGNYVWAHPVGILLSRVLGRLFLTCSVRWAPRALFILLIIKTEAQRLVLCAGALERSLSPQSTGLPGLSGAFRVHTTRVCPQSRRKGSGNTQNAQQTLPHMEACRVLSSA